MNAEQSPDRRKRVLKQKENWIYSRMLIITWIGNVSNAEVIDKLKT